MRVQGTPTRPERWRSATSATPVNCHRATAYRRNRGSTFAAINHPSASRNLCQNHIPCKFTGLVDGLVHQVPLQLARELERQCVADLLRAPPLLQLGFARSTATRCRGPVCPIWAGVGGRGLAGALRCASAHGAHAVRSDDPAAVPTAMLSVPGWCFTSGISYYTCRLAHRDHRDRTDQCPADAPAGADPALPWARSASPSTTWYMTPSVNVFDGLDWFWGRSISKARRFPEANRPQVLILQW